MTVANLHRNFRIFYDNIDSSYAAEVTPEQLDVFFNTAQEDLLLWCKKEGLESTQTIRDYLRNLKTNANQINFFNTADNEPNGWFVSFPEDYRTLMKSETTVTYIDCHGVTQTKRIKDKPITEDVYNNIIKDPFRKPNIGSQDEFTVSMEFKNLFTVPVSEVITDGTFTPTIYHIRYLRNPVNIQYGSQYAIPTVDVDCELNEEAQNDIIERAVILAKLAVQAQTYQLNQQHKLAEQ